MKIFVWLLFPTILAFSLSCGRDETPRPTEEPKPPSAQERAASFEGAAGVLCAPLESDEKACRAEIVAILETAEVRQMDGLVRKLEVAKDPGQVVRVLKEDLPVEIGGAIRRQIDEHHAVDYLHEIKLRQEIFFSVMGEYVDSSNAPASFADADFYPPEEDGKVGRWNIECDSNSTEPSGWCKLAPSQPPKTTDFQYVTVGWNPKDPSPPGQFVRDPSRRWYFALARRKGVGGASPTTLLMTSEESGIQKLP